MASYTYLDSPNANLNTGCSSRSPFVEPCTTRTCCHTFCYECISQAITISRHCPIDRTPLSLHDLAPADPVIRNLVDELVVKCPQERLGCTYNCQRLLLSVHLRDSCQYVQVNCQKPGCARRFLKKDADKHRCEDVVSEHSLDEALLPDDVQDGCPSVVGDDPTSATDTPQPSPRPSQADLAAENTFLQLRLAALENVVHSLRNEMFAVKHALGPWYRPEVQPQSYEDVQPMQAVPRPSAQHTDTSQQNDIRNNYAAPASDSSFATLADHPDIASYFPTSNEETSDSPPRIRLARAATNTQQTPLSPSTQQPPAFTSSSTSPPAMTYSNLSQGNAHNSTYAPGSYTPSASLLGMSHLQSTPLATAAPATVDVPPLDPTTPLPDTLASLHSSLVTIAGALGALAAARGSEALRTAEEIRGLRGAMHGLRMQVHDILTSRTHLPAHGAVGSGGGSADPDGGDASTLGVGTPPWSGYGARVYGYPMYTHPFPPPHVGIPHPPPTNITKL
ncbi:hypothetical protein C8Q78DRAFT_1066841 [Trametes maxima]|nr:hypothetical protein C8Q78DRAFT_1066841 [Trametes maxima]